MKRIICAFMLAIVTIASLTVSGFAASNKPVFESSYDADSNTVSVKLYIESPAALESADFCLAFDEDVFEYVDCSEESSSDNMMIMAGQAATENGLATCSLIFTESCKDSDLNDEGNLVLATFKFKPLTDEYDINDFYLWADSYSVSGTNISNSVEPMGNATLKTGHTSLVTTPNYNSNNTTTKSDDKNDKKDDNANNNNSNNSSSSSNSNGRKWYVYVITGVIVVCAVGGIALIAIKNNHENDETDKSADDSQTDNSEEK